MCPDLARWRGPNDARVLSNSNAAVLYSRIVLNAIAYQRQNRNDVSVGNCFLSWTAVPRLQPED